MTAADFATVLALVLPFLFFAGLFVTYLATINSRDETFAAEFIPEQADVAADVQAIDDAMLEALRGRTA